MTTLQPQRGEVPVPVPTLASKPFWEGCAAGELRYQTCRRCGSAMAPSIICGVCSSRDLEWNRSDGVGEIYSWTTVWRPQIPSFEVPYVAIIVDVDEGWQLLSNLIGCPADAVEIGLRVEVDFREMQGGFTLPYFRPVATG